MLFTSFHNGNPLVQQDLQLLFFLCSPCTVLFLPKICYQVSPNPLEKIWELQEVGGEEGKGPLHMSACTALDFTYINSSRASQVFEMLSF